MFRYTRDGSDAKQLEVAYHNSAGEPPATSSLPGSYKMIQSGSGKFNNALRNRQQTAEKILGPRRHIRVFIAEAHPINLRNRIANQTNTQCPQICETMETATRNYNHEAPSPRRLICIRCDEYYGDCWHLACG
jgi:hypothetical protein